MSNRTSALTTAADPREHRRTGDARRVIKGRGDEPTASRDRQLERERRALQELLESDDVFDD